MAEPTEADRQKAWLVLCALPISIPGYSPETVRKAQDHLAQALADERERARAPFLARAAEWERQHRDSVALNGVEHWVRGDDIAEHFRRAAEETGQ